MTSYHHIVVIGGGFGGSLSALVCSQIADRVTLIDPYPYQPCKGNQGTPQSHHGHIMVKRGQNQIDKLLPGILSKLKESGAIEADWAQDTQWLMQGGAPVNYDSGIRSLLFSRHLIDRLLGERVKATKNVDVIKGQVKTYNFRSKRIDGVGLADGRHIAEADFFIEATGRSSQLKAQLEKVVGPIAHKNIENTLRYVSATFPNDKNHGPWLQHYRQAHSVEAPLGYYASPIEGGKILVTAADYHGTIAEPFAQLSTIGAIAGRKPDLIKVHTKLGSYHAQYGKSPRFIENLAIIGDAVCRLNPLYGHGMTLCIEQVVLLQDFLFNGKRNTLSLQQEIDKSVKIPWRMVAIDESRRNPKKPFGHGMIHRYLDCLRKVSINNQHVHLATLLVLHRLKEPRTLLRPQYIMGVIKFSLLQRFQLLKSALSPLLILQFFGAESSAHSQMLELDASDDFSAARRG